MKILQSCAKIIASMTLVFSATSFADGSAPVDPEPEIDFETVIFPIIQDNCTSCHRGIFAAARIRLDTEENVLENSSAALFAIESGRMPRGNPGFAETEDGLTLIDWLWSLEEPVEPQPETNL